MECNQAADTISGSLRVEHSRECSGVQSAFIFVYTDPIRSSLCRAGLCTVSESCCTAFAGASAHAALNCLYVERGSLV